MLIIMYTLDCILFVCKTLAFVVILYSFIVSKQKEKKLKRTMQIDIFKSVNVFLSYKHLQVCISRQLTTVSY